MLGTISSSIYAFSSLEVFLLKILHEENNRLAQRYDCDEDTSIGYMNCLIQPLCQFISHLHNSFNRSSIKILSSLQNSQSI